MQYQKLWGGGKPQLNILHLNKSRLSSCREQTHLKQHKRYNNIGEYLKSYIHQGKPSHQHLATCAYEASEFSHGKKNPSWKSFILTGLCLCNADHNVWLSAAVKMNFWFYKSSNANGSSVHSSSIGLPIIKINVKMTRPGGRIITDCCPARQAPQPFQRRMNVLPWWVLNSKSQQTQFVIPKRNAHIKFLQRSKASLVMAACFSLYKYEDATGLAPRDLWWKATYMHFSPLVLPETLLLLRRFPPWHN